MGLTALLHFKAMPRNNVDNNLLRFNSKPEISHDNVFFASSSTMQCHSVVSSCPQDWQSCSQKMENGVLIAEDENIRIQHV